MGTCATETEEEEDDACPEYFIQTAPCSIQDGGSLVCGVFGPPGLDLILYHAGKST